MIIVMIVIALLATLGAATLSNSQVTAQIGVNSVSIAQADLMAESAVNYAIYNLKYPSKAYGASPPSGWYWTGTGSTPLTFGSAIPGSVNITVTGPSNGFTGSYEISVTANQTTGSNTFTRNKNATVAVVQTQAVSTAAALFNSNLTLNSGMTINGDIRVNGNLTLNGTAKVTGTAYANSITAPAGAVGVISQGNSNVGEGSDPSKAAPQSVKDYTTYQDSSGITRSATLLTTDPVAGTTLGPTASNPYGVYYASNRSLTLNGVTVNGTVIVKNGSVVVKGSVANTITPQSNMPAMVVDGAVTVNGASRTLTVNGVLWSKTGINGSGSTAGSNVTINGTLMIPNSGAISSTYTGALTLNYDASKIAVGSNFAGYSLAPTSVTVSQWDPAQ